MFVINTIIHVSVPKCLITLNKTNKPKEKRCNKWFSRLFTVDKEGTGLVSSQNGALQLWTHLGAWTTLTLKEKTGHPVDVVIDPVDNGIWVLDRHKQLWKFVPE